MARRAEGTNTAEMILDVAERFVQQQGYNGFSYADVASELGITKAALHYHFASKAELGEALVVRYAERFQTALVQISDLANAAEQLSSYAELYLDVIRDRRMCLCGMLAAEYQTLPVAMQHAVAQFFHKNETWLAAVLEKGRRVGDLHFTGPAAETARVVIGGLEGAMLLARIDHHSVRVETTVARLLATLRRPPDRASLRTAGPR